MFPYWLRETGSLETARPKGTLPWLAAMVATQLWDGERVLRRGTRVCTGRRPLCLRLELSPMVTCGARPLKTAGLECVAESSTLGKAS